MLKIKIQGPKKVSNAKAKWFVADMKFELIAAVEKLAASDHRTQPSCLLNAV